MAAIRTCLIDKRLRTRIGAGERLKAGRGTETEEVGGGRQLFGLEVICVIMDVCIVVSGCIF